MKGYSGKILKIDLSTKSINIIETFQHGEKFLGGRGIAVKLLYDHLKPQTDALSPGNVLIFMTGPLTGTLSPSSGRIDVVAKSPETNLLGGSNAGGFFGPELKNAGFDGIVILGKSEAPVYIEINNDHVEIKDATDIFNKNVFETIGILTKNNENAHVACIGNADKSLSNLSGIAFGNRNYAARGGMGAVMGSKNLKAIMVRGTKGVEIFDPKALSNVSFEIQQRIKNMPLYNDASQWHWKLFDSLEKDGKSFYGNYEDKKWKETGKAKENIEDFIANNQLGPESCFGCPLRCWAFIHGDNTEGAPIIACQGTWTSIANFMKITDAEMIWKIYVLCQKGGLDVSGVSSLMAFLMELYEKNIINEKDTDGIAINWGDGNAVISLIHKIIAREGFGAVIADGIKAAALKIGKGAEKYAVYGKGGLELWLMEMRPFKGVSLISAVTDSGSSNRASYAFPEFFYISMPAQAKMIAKNILGDEDAGLPTKYEGKIKMVAFYEDLHILSDSLGICSIPFQPAGLDNWALAFEATTGIKMTVKDLMLSSARIRTLERLINVREGMTREDDTFSDKLFTEKIKDGPWADEVIDKEKFEKMKDEYYKFRGWDNNGIPFKETVEFLKL